MNIKVRVPLSLHKFTGNKTDFECQGETVEKLLTNMNCQYPGIKEILYDEEGSLRPPFSVFVNGKSVRFLKNEEILLKDGDEILIMQLVAGG
jgi:molybdopterin synthase sulfur carrier subunit